jgi:hypothetical protein
MRIYLDACSLQRPLDDRGQPRINVEAEAVLTILALVESGNLELVSSEVLEFEVANTPDVQRQARAHAILKLASQVVKVTDETETQADTLVKLGIKPLYGRRSQEGAPRNSEDP